MNKYDYSEATIAIKKLIKSRGWEKFQNIPDLVISIVLESSELLEKIQWLDIETIQEKTEKNNIYRIEFINELADIAINVISLSELLNINLNNEIIRKCELINNRFSGKINYGDSRQVIICNSCKNSLKGEWLFCPSCGIKTNYSKSE